MAEDLRDILEMYTVVWAKGGLREEAEEINNKGGCRWKRNAAGSAPYILYFTVRINAKIVAFSGLFKVGAWRPAFRTTFFFGFLFLSSRSV